MSSERITANTKLVSLRVPLLLMASIESAAKAGRRTRTDEMLLRLNGSADFSQKTVKKKVAAPAPTDPDDYVDEAGCEHKRRKDLGYGVKCADCGKML